MDNTALIRVIIRDCGGAREIARRNGYASGAAVVYNWKYRGAIAARERMAVSILLEERRALKLEERIYLGR